MARAPARKRTRSRKQSKKPAREFYAVIIALAIVLAMFLIIPLLYDYNLVSANAGDFYLNADFELLFPFAALTYMYAKGGSTRGIIDSLGLSGKRFSTQFMGIGLLLFIIVVAMELALGAISTATGVQINTNVTTVLGTAPAWFLVFAVVVSPLCEEIFFRGLLVPRIGIVISAVIFGLLHFGYNSTFEVEIISAFIFGLLAGYIFKKTGSLYPSLIAHILVNLLAVLAIVTAL